MSSRDPSFKTRVLPKLKSFTTLITVICLTCPTFKRLTHYLIKLQSIRPPCLYLMFKLSRPNQTWMISFWKFHICCQIWRHDALLCPHSSANTLYRGIIPSNFCLFSNYYFGSASLVSWNISSGSCCEQTSFVSQTLMFNVSLQKLGHWFHWFKN